MVYTKVEVKRYILKRKEEYIMSILSNSLSMEQTKIVEFDRKMSK